MEGCGRITPESLLRPRPAALTSAGGHLFTLQACTAAASVLASGWAPGSFQDGWTAVWTCTPRVLPPNRDAPGPATQGIVPDAHGPRRVLQKRSRGDGKACTDPAGAPDGARGCPEGTAPPAPPASRPYPGGPSRALGPLLWAGTWDKIDQVCEREDHVFTTPPCGRTPLPGHTCAPPAHRAT